MSDEPKKPARRKPTGKGHKATAAKPRATPKGPGNDSRGGPGGGALTPALWIAARALYESQKETSYPSVAKEFGISTTTVSRRAREERWTKNVENLKDMTERAQHIADNAKARLADLGPALNEPGKVEEVQREVTIDTGAEVRAKVIDRHRQEWAAPRKLAYEAVSKRDFDLAKLAKITSETLKNVQDGERKAWGMDRGGDGGETVTVVIDRE